MWYQIWLVLVGVSIGLILSLIINSQLKGFLPTLTDIMRLLIMILVGILGLNIYYELTNTQPNQFFNASFIQILQVGATAGLSAISVYLTRRHYEDTQREIAKEEIVTPLYYEVQEILHNLRFKNFTSSEYLGRHMFDVWGSMKEKMAGIKAKNIDPSIPDTYDKINLFLTKYNDTRTYYLKVITDIFFDTIVSRRTTEHFKPIQYNPFFFIYKTGYVNENHLDIVKYLIFNENPISFIEEEDTLFSKQDCRLNYWYLEKNNTSGNNDLDYEDIESDFEDFLVQIEMQLKKDSKIILLRQERRLLIQSFDSIESKLQKYIS